MINGSNAMKLTNDSNMNYISVNKAQILHKVNSNRKHKWRIKDSHEAFYWYLGHGLGFMAIIGCILLFAFGVSCWL